MFHESVSFRCIGDVTEYPFASQIGISLSYKRIELRGCFEFGYCGFHWVGKCQVSAAGQFWMLVYKYLKTHEGKSHLTGDNWFHMLEISLGRHMPGLSQVLVVCSKLKA